MIKTKLRLLTLLSVALLCNTKRVWAQNVGDLVWTTLNGSEFACIVTGTNEVSFGSGGYNQSFYYKLGVYTIPTTMSLTYKPSYDSSTWVTKTWKVTGISDNCFEYASQLRNVIIPEGIKTIGKRAFYNAGSENTLTGSFELKLPSTLKTIDDEAFLFCYFYKSVDFSKSKVTTIPKSCFSCNHNLESINLGTKVQEIGIGAFEGSALTEVTIPATVKTIRADAFRSNHLESVTFMGDETWLDTIPKTTEPSGKVYTFSQQIGDNGTILPDMYGVPFYLNYHFTWANGYQSLDQYIGFGLSMTKSMRTFASTLNMEFDADAYVDGLKVYTVSEIDAANARVILRENEPTDAGHLLLYGSECYVLSGTVGHRYLMERENTAWQARSASYLMGDGKVVVNPLGQISSALVQPTETRDGVQYTNMTLVDGKFVALTAATYLPAGEAYLSVPTSEIETIIENSSGAPQLTIAIGDFDDNNNGGTTSAGAADYLRPAGSPSVYYDLNGHRLEQPRKGINIVNGKKVIIK